MTERVGRREIALLVHYVLWLSVHLLFVLSGIVNGSLALAGAAVSGTFALNVVLAQHFRDHDGRLSRWAFLTYLSLNGLLVLMDLALVVTDGEPFARVHRRA